MPTNRRPVPARAVLAALLAVAPLGARAQDASTPPAAAPAADPVVEAFRRADTDGDGRLSRAEAERLPTVGGRFPQYDDDRDGFLSLEEYRKGFPVAGRADDAQAVAGPERAAAR